MWGDGGASKVAAVENGRARESWQWAEEETVSRTHKYLWAYEMTFACGGEWRS